MKLVLPITTSFIFLQPSHAQMKSNETYAIVSVETNYDKTKKIYWCSMKAESGGKYSKEITSLVKYSSDKNTSLPGIAFYHEKKDSSLIYFNYFLSTTEALQFLADHGWQLVTVNNNFISDYENVKDGEGKLVPVTKLTSIPVYFFKKEIVK